MNFKKTLLSIILPLGLLVSGCLRPVYQEDLLWRARLDHKAWKEVNSENPKSLDYIRSFLGGIIYVPERKQRWFSAKKTIELGFGDCEEIATVGAYLAEKLGYSPEILLLFNESEKFTHAVTLLKEQKEGKIKYGVIEKNDLFYPVYDSIGSLSYNMNRIYDEHYLYYTVLDLNNFNKNWRTSNKDMKTFNELMIPFFKIDYKPSQEQKKSLN